MIRAQVAEAACSLGLTGRRVLVAISGGVDSSVLLELLQGCAAELRLSLRAGHVNHGLRGAESDADERCARQTAERLGIDFRAARVEPETLRRGRSSRSRPTLQEAARRLRYDALHELAAAEGAEHIATAHTLDDQAETVLLRLLRGAGPDGLGGIPECSPEGRIVRPLLGISRAEVLAHARSQGLVWREDPSNRSEAYPRSRLRQRWLPGLIGAFNPRLLRAIADLAEAQRRDSEWIEAAVAREGERRFRKEGRVLWMAQEGWQDLPEALARRLVRRALREVGGARDVSRVHIQRMLAFLSQGTPGARLQLPGGLELVRQVAGFSLAPVSVAAVRDPAACYAPGTSIAVPAGTRGEGGREQPEPSGPQENHLDPPGMSPRS